ncbi:MAG: hypothetical protein A2958_03105 [Candidatus Levybacteria bacterium RIFCSPLOWO2_01_FULL_38_13]|nr:MAG: hypothetical protein A2629_03520 [Candidatus Levybacteria bacterium RIFCSPHIGHO2_01_FULL_41_15]OGH35310.1 MAG: hypothetical protein A2958_03105 [Candidatus Levybacteria bacterium RIFCSPLOWO2_01_FULL_38_13]
MKKILLVFLLLFLLFLPGKTSASSNFDADYDISYAVSENGNTRVEIKVALTNKTSSYYASSYKINVGFDDPKNPRASDLGGNILKSVSKTSEGQEINVIFNDRITGLGNKLNFTIAFDTNEVARKVGKIWEVNIPGFLSQSDLSDFSVYVSVPSSFGSPSFVKPSLSDGLKKNENIYTFSKDQLGNSGISITFGNEQIYKLDLTYHLYNKNLFPIKTEIALPPNTGYQEVEIDSINPKPSNVTIDEDGNWLAQYTLSSSQRLDVSLKAKVKISLFPEKQNYTEEQLQSYLKEDKYWQISNNEIKQLSRNLKNPKSIYEYVVKKLKYDYSRVETEKPRIGAAGVLQKPESAVCLEFTDLFIALARASGIPAREVDGYAYTQNTRERPLSLVKDVLHAWPEYYDREKAAWIMVDPTWGNTTGGIDYFETLDFDHIAFVIKGHDSTYPVPAGGYKLPGNEKVKDVRVSFANEFAHTSPTLEISDNIPKNLTAGLPLMGNITLENTGTLLSFPQKITVRSYYLKPNLQNIYLKPIPPYGNLVLPLSFEAANPLTNRTDLIRIGLGSNLFERRVRIYPILFSKWGLVVGGGILIVAIFISALAFKSWNIPFFGQKG